MGDEDDTVRLSKTGKLPHMRQSKHPAPQSLSRRRSGYRALQIAVPVLLAAAAGGGWWLFHSLGTPPLQVIADIPSRDEAGILLHRAASPVMFRYAGNPAVFVLDFPTLTQQAAALNRVAALVEKAGLPRDRVLTQAEMAAVITAAGDTAETFYFGHNYRGADLARFFALAARDRLPLTTEETWVTHQLARAQTLHRPGADIVLVSISAPQGAMDAAARSSILRHELGHGLFGTVAGFAEHVTRVWQTRFTENDRAAFRVFLHREGYDTSDARLVVDETQAYLLFTPDPRFFSPGLVGLSAERVAQLRDLLRENAPRLEP